MKKTKFFIALSSFAMAAAGFAALGSSAKKADPVKAGDSYTGSIIIQKNDNDMRYTGSKLVAYFFDDNSHTGWGTAVNNTDTRYQEYSWSLDFNPTTIIVLRVDGANWSSSNPWSNVWCRTGNQTLSGFDVLYMNGNATEGGNWGTYSVDAVVKGGASDDWTVQTINTTLNHVKISGKDSLEVYGDVSLPANSYFKVVKTNSEWCGAYTADASIASNLSNSESGNIHNVAAADYEFYFDYDYKTTYITDPVLAAADEWAQTFLGANCTATKSGWTSAASDYAGLDTAVKNKIKTQAHIDHKASAEGYVAQAVQRYDYVLELYGVYDASENPDGYTDFLQRANSYVTPGRLQSSGVFANLNQDSSAIVPIIVVVSLVSVSTLGSLLIIKRKRAHQ